MLSLGESNVGFAPSLRSVSYHAILDSVRFWEPPWPVLWTHHFTLDMSCRRMIAACRPDNVRTGFAVGKT